MKTWTEYNSISEKEWPWIQVDDTEIPLYPEMLKNLEKPDCQWCNSCRQSIALLSHKEFCELIKIVKNKAGWTKEEINRLCVVRGKEEISIIMHGWVDYV